MGAVVNEEAFCLKWNDFHTSLTSTFTELRAESDLLDATIFCEGKEIRGVMFCHLAVLVCLHGEVKVRRAVRVAVSDESEPSWLELKDFQLGSARLGSARDHFPFNSKWKIGRNELQF